MSTTTYPVTWDLETFFRGGSESEELRAHLDEGAEKVRSYAKAVADFSTPEAADAAEKIVALIEQTKNTSAHLREAGAVIGCFLAQDTTDKKANLLQGETSALGAKFQTAFMSLQQKLSKTDEKVWEELLASGQLEEFSFILGEWRKKAGAKLPEEQEALITGLSVDGYHGWGELYDLLVGDMQVKVTVDGEEKVLSVGQANNLGTHSDPAVRKEAFEKLEAAWAEKEEFFAKALNSLAGFRLQVYEKRGWDQVLREPLEYNRMKQETLDAMWGAISANKGPFAEYLNRKATLLGKDQLDWYDFFAPVSESASKLDYQDGAEFILKHFGKFGPELESFARMAFENGWIEAEDRPNKRPGGFCTGMPLSEESRIFMTYSGSMSNVATLAHELGHAFHSYALRPVHQLNRQYAMNVAETASTFAEMIVADAAVKEAGTKEEKIALLEDKAQRSVSFFMNIHARFLFETRFYEERKKGVVSTARLNELMEEAQREAYAGALGEAHPHFWASKLHFYITGVPFYNFPYTFGYLFSLSIYAKALEEGEAFEEKYMALLRDTAVMTTEDLAMKHLGEDITKQDFWEKGVRLCIRDVEEFLSLTSNEG
ncbi:oligoendopeptidase, pepF/M3 family [Bhargavaea ginsengi]|uniref:Oligoendopeptidase, pepF/M3 family n=1 Tax=Bhargavaea ginsengi TaxID=426757 RepID=A0A1H7B3N4_9BACL|nr:M3 family oligoendopeptidase [Bhargavaea ginsengi]MCM3088000.1 M3 family oligoendopeptidase [Bhargavaea ginsengi]SEJ69022.1 oligoendopeptidase, pepF/M3 family [Bhargavaea ginsengi]